MTFKEYIDMFHLSPTSFETKGDKEYCYYSNGSYDVYECDSSGYYTVSSYKDNVCYQRCDGYKNEYYDIYDLTGEYPKYKETGLFFGPGRYDITKYENGVRSTYTIYDGEHVYTNYYDANGLVNRSIDNNIETLYTYDDNHAMKSIITHDPEWKDVTKTYYDNGDILKQHFISDQLDYSNVYHDNRLIKSEKYIYTEDGVIYNKKLYTYNSDNKNNVMNDYYYNDELILHLDESIDSVSFDEKTNEFVFSKNDSGEFLRINKQGDRTYIFNSEYSEYAYRLKINKDGSYEIPNQNIYGKYQFDQNGNIICTDQNGLIYEYNSFGQLIKKETNDGIVEYNQKYNSQKITKNGIDKYAMQNHIEYDEEIYENIMKSMNNIGEEYPSLINNDCNNCVDIINSFADKYSSGEIAGVNNEVQQTISTINQVKESINYSLLAYQGCDRHLEERTHALIDSLFSDNEKSLAETFKLYINKHVEDINNDNILYYKKDTNFNEVFGRLLPLDEYVDADGNVWYYNLKGELISVKGDGLKINYGGTEFKIEVTEKGIIKLIDQDGNNFNIFGEYNLDTEQYGGCQMNFTDSMVVKNEKIMQILDSYFPNASLEEKINYLHAVSETSCGNIAVTNWVFKELEGQEEKFYDIFGYPMYSITKGNNGNSVNINYEPVALDLFCQQNYKSGNIVDATLSAHGTDVTGIGPEGDLYQMYNYLHSKYGLFSDNYSEDVANSGIFCSFGYTLFDFDGNVVLANGDGHVMTKICDYSDSQWIVSSWGRKLICKYDEVFLPESNENYDY